MKKRVRRAGRDSLTPISAPRDLARRVAEVQALRELVRIEEKQIQMQTPAKKKDGSFRRPPARS
jgi:hypothetical protein